MTADELIKSIYLGDRSCKGVLIYTLPARVELWIDCISRIRDPSGEWNYYTDEDLIDGRIIFTEVESVSMEPSGWLPNDYIESLKLIRQRENGWYEFEFVTCATKPGGESAMVMLRIVARGIELAACPPVERPSDNAAGSN